MMESILGRKEETKQRQVATLSATLARMRGRWRGGRRLANRAQ